MMGVRVFVDTNVLVYARDANEPEKRDKAQRWLERLWDGNEGCLSYQVLQEFYNAVIRKLAPSLPEQVARQDIRALAAWRPVRTDLTVLEGAWRLQESYFLSWWDALIVAAALEAECDFLLTEDLQDGQDLGGLQVVDPFWHGPETVGPRA